RAIQRLPQEFDIHFHLPRRNSFGDFADDAGKFDFGRQAVHDDDPISADADIAAPRIDNVQTVMLLFSNIADAQLFVIQEFNDPPFERHAYNSVICLMRCSVRWSDPRCESKTENNWKNFSRGRTRRTL